MVRHRFPPYQGMNAETLAHRARPIEMTWLVTASIVRLHQLYARTLLQGQSRRHMVRGAAEKCKEDFTKIGTSKSAWFGHTPYGRRPGSWVNLAQCCPLIQSAYRRVRMDQQELLDGIACMLIKNHQILAEKRKLTEKVGPGALALPGGHMEMGEAPEHALRRTLREALDIR